MDIYICEFRTGEYSDRTFIPIAAFCHQRDAIDFANKLNKFLEEKKLLKGQNPPWEIREHAIELPDMDDTFKEKLYVDYTGAMIHVYPNTLKLRGYDE